MPVGVVYCQIPLVELRAAMLCWIRDLSCRLALICNLDPLVELCWRRWLVLDLLLELRRFRWL